MNKSTIAIYIQLALVITLITGAGNTTTDCVLLLLIIIVGVTGHILDKGEV